MARPTPRLGQRGLSFFGSIATLAAWRWRQQWFLLLITGVGMITAIMMVCSIPLFSGVMLTAGLRGTLRASPRSSQAAFNIDVLGLAPGSMNQVSTRVTSSLQARLGSYTQGAPRLDLTAFDFDIHQHLDYHMDLYGISIPAAARRPRSRRRPRPFCRHVSRPRLSGARGAARRAAWGDRGRSVSRSYGRRPGYIVADRSRQC